MNKEQMQRAVEFITHGLAESVARNAIIEENFKELPASQDKLQGKLETPTDLTRNLVTVAQIHPRRLDRLEGIQPR